VKDRFWTTECRSDVLDVRRGFNQVYEAKIFVDRLHNGLRLLASATEQESAGNKIMPLLRQRLVASRARNVRQPETSSETGTVMCILTVHCRHTRRKARFVEAREEGMEWQGSIT
jgi:hypothetical protein